MVLAPDQYADAHLAPGLERLSGILIGIAVLEPVPLPGHVLSPSTQRHSRDHDTAGK